MHTTAVPLQTADEKLQEIDEYNAGFLSLSYREHAKKRLRVLSQDEDSRVRDAALAALKRRGWDEEESTWERAHY